MFSQTLNSKCQKVHVNSTTLYTRKLKNSNKRNSKRNIYSKSLYLYIMYEYFFKLLILIMGSFNNVVQ